MGSLKPNKFGRSTDFTGTRPPSGKVKFWDPRSSTNGGTHKPKVTTTVTVRKLLQPLNGADANVNVKINSRVNIKESSLNSQSFEQDKLKSKKQREVGRNKPSSSSKPAGKVKFWDPLTAGHDQQPKVTTTIHVSRGKPLKNSGNIDPNDGEAKRFQPEELRRKKSSFGSKDSEAQKSAVTTTASQKENEKREKIKEAMNVFDQVYPQLSHEN
ncbi:uncharacterized protein LOC143630965 [Bidens hawaiensis]|uniref:uncharacterized protein LOC143630965 n=1 Tax=Bidens hawaiensis TaxID=980011 RepID=UPI004049A2AD